MLWTTLNTTGNFALTDCLPSSMTRSTVTVPSCSLICPASPSIGHPVFVLVDNCSLSRVERHVPAADWRAVQENSLAIERHLRDLREGVMRVRLVPVGEIFRQPRHPYTLGLLASRPGQERKDARLMTIPGQPVNVADARRHGFVLPIVDVSSCGDRRKTLAPGTAMRIYTGAPLPAGADDPRPRRHQRARLDRTGGARAAEPLLRHGVVAGRRPAGRPGDVMILLERTDELRQLTDAVRSVKLASGAARVVLDAGKRWIGQVAQNCVVVDADDIHAFFSEEADGFRTDQAGGPGYDGNRHDRTSLKQLEALNGDYKPGFEKFWLSLGHQLLQPLAAGAIAHQLGLKIAMNAWLGPNTDANERRVASGSAFGPVRSSRRRARTCGRSASRRLPA